MKHLLLYVALLLNKCTVLESAVEVGVGRIPVTLDTVHLSIGAPW